MTWEQILTREEKKPYFKQIMQHLDSEVNSAHTIYPPRDKIFEALKLTPLSATKVVILGQDPYHGPNEAHGLAFSVLCSKIPPSLKNIFKELHHDLNTNIPSSGDLSSWARQGVLLLNTSLTVRHKQPNSHSRIGWQKLTDQFINAVSDHQPFVVFILWGGNAQSKKSLIHSRHTILESAHPSPLSCYRGFINSKPFSQANQYLIKNGLAPINWSLE